VFDPLVAPLVNALHEHAGRPVLGQTLIPHGCFKQPVFGSISVLASYLQGDGSAHLTTGHFGGQVLIPQGCFKQPVFGSFSVLVSYLQPGSFLQVATGHLSHSSLPQGYLRQLLVSLLLSVTSLHGGLG